MDKKTERRMDDDSYEISLFSRDSLTELTLAILLELAFREIELKKISQVKLSNIGRILHVNES